MQTTEAQRKAYTKLKEDGELEGSDVLTRRSSTVSYTLNGREVTKRWLYIKVVLSLSTTIIKYKAKKKHLTA